MFDPALFDPALFDASSSVGHIVVNGVEMSNRVDFRTLTPLDSDLTQISTASFVIEDPNRTLISAQVPRLYHEVLIYDDDGITLLFGGYINTVTELDDTEVPIGRSWRIDVQDYSVRLTQTATGSLNKVGQIDTDRNFVIAILRDALADQGFAAAANVAEVDGDMETAGTAAYTSTDATIAKDTTTVYAGAQSLSVTRTAAYGYGARAGSLAVGRSVTATVHCYGEGDFSSLASVSLYSTPSNTLLTPTAYVTGPDVWEELNVSGTIPVGDTGWEVRLEMADSFLGGTVAYFDNLLVDTSAGAALVIDDAIITANEPDWPGVQFTAFMSGLDWSYMPPKNALSNLYRYVPNVYLTIGPDKIVTYGLRRDLAAFSVSTSPDNVNLFAYENYTEETVISDHVNKMRRGGAGASEFTAVDGVSYALFNRILDAGYENNTSVPAEDLERRTYAELRTRRIKRRASFRVRQKGLKAGYLTDVVNSRLGAGTFPGPMGWPGIGVGRSASGAIAGERNRWLITAVRTTPLGNRNYAYDVSVGDPQIDFPIQLPPSPVT